jgi:alcohol dehydrogenase class IV
VEAQQRLAELALMIGAGSAADDAALLAHKFIKAVRDLRIEVGIPDQMDVIKHADFEILSQQAIAEGALYPVPRLLDRESVIMILNSIAK